MSLRQKLSLLSIGAVVATSLATVLLVQIFLTRKIESWWEKRYQSFTEAQVKPAAKAVANDELVFLDVYVWDLQAGDGLYVDSVTVFDVDGAVLVTTEEDEAARQDTDAMLFGAPLNLGSASLGRIELTFDRTPITAAVGEIRRLLLVIALVGSLIAAIAAARIADRLVKPLTSLTKRVSELTEDDTAELVHVDSNDEIGRISNAILDAYQELRKRGQRNRRMVGELREVTTKLQSELEINAGLRERLEEENRILQERVRDRREKHNVIGEDGDLASTVERARSAAKSKLTVLLTGESGTGKEVLAELVHKSSERRDKNFVTVNCAALPDNLIESELFGHEKGAFTGAIGAKSGKFMLASGGTIFLDEIGELPLNMQPKLLRVLETQEIDRVGADRPTKVDVRVIVATNRDLQEEVEAGRFREDLYYRINVVTIEIPPLRDRPRDLERLAKQFLEEIALEMRIAPPVVSPAALDRLRSYSWPGNVRELRHLLAATLSHHPVVVLEPEHLGTLLQRQGRVGHGKGRSTSTVSDGGWDRKETFDDYLGRLERDVLDRQLKTGATQKEVAQRLSVSEARLHRLLKKHGLLRRLGRSHIGAGA